MMRKILGLFRRPAANEEQPEDRLKSADDLDATLHRLIERVDSSMNDLRGDGTSLIALIKKVEQTTRKGVSAMKGSNLRHDPTSG